jgi:hypothetical protein
MGAIFAASTTLMNGTERRLRSKEHNRADWRTTLRYARVTQCTPNCDITRLRTPQNQIGTAFGTARFIWLSLSADDISLFWRVGPIHPEEVWTKSSQRELARFNIHTSTTALRQDRP